MVRAVTFMEPQRGLLVNVELITFFLGVLRILFYSIRLERPLYNLLASGTASFIRAQTCQAWHVLKAVRVCERDKGGAGATPHAPPIHAHTRTF